MDIGLEKPTLDHREVIEIGRKREGRCREGGHRLRRCRVQPQPREVGETGVEGSAAGVGESCPSRRTHPFLRLLFSSSEVGEGCVRNAAAARRTRGRRVEGWGGADKLAEGGNGVLPSAGSSGRGGSGRRWPVQRWSDGGSTASAHPCGIASMVADSKAGGSVCNGGPGAV
uniref:DUF834 domain-containing protein n=1 Tax=Oryza punctata TaxID=4537 RepID=A0A0E0MDP8_ORYPU